MAPARNPQRSALDAMRARNALALLVALLALCWAATGLAQPSAADGRAVALQALASADADERTRGVQWLGHDGTKADASLLEERLRDDDDDVRVEAERALWRLWGRSGDPAIDALLATGVDAMAAGNLDAAIATFTSIVVRRPDFAEAWNKRATALFLAGEYRRSLADCDEVIKRNPTHFGALAGYGQIYFQLEQYERAIAFWKRALAVNPNMSGVEVNIRATEALIAAQRKRSA